MRSVELLSPAGDFEGLKMAVFGGANAVYFGAKGFNARAKANNFGEDLPKAVAFCHMFGVKAYLTLNTIVENDEINELIGTAKYALECGIDAFIVQDFGVVNILKNCFSNIEIHASTQMAVNNYLGALKLKEMGIKRVVLSRETSLEDIKLIKQKTNLEIEYFVQGALCVCFSGNCYLSSRLFGKSGNRGECMQPCRLPYKAFLKGKQLADGYLLSAKDMNMSKRLKELIDAGVDSFKIEGRLRRPAYIAGATQTYRRIIDNDFQVNNGDTITLKKCFNRGDFTEGYFNGNGNIIDCKIQGHKGLKIGNVIEYIAGNRFNIIKIKSSHNITKGDVLKFINNGIENATITAVDIKNSNGVYTITTTNKVVVGSDVHLISDVCLETELMGHIKKLPVNFSLLANVGEKLKLEYEFNGKSGIVYGEICQTANTQPLTENEARTQLSKMGTTNFYLNDFKLQTNGVFVRKQELNSLRNMAIEEIENSFICKEIVDVDYSYIGEDLPHSNIKNNNLTYEIGELYNTSRDILIVRPQNYKDFNYSKISHKNAFLFVPSYLTHKDIDMINEILDNNENLGVYADNISYVGYKNKRIILGAKLNIKNVYAIKELINDRVFAIMISPELTEERYDELSKFYSVPVLASSFENFDLMTLVHCPIKMIFGNNCANCKYQDGITYKMENGRILTLKRYKIHSCTFVLR